jgi:hypothetical protein
MDRGSKVGSGFLNCGLRRNGIFNRQRSTEHGEDQCFKLVGLDAATDKELVGGDGDAEVGDREIAAGVGNDRKAIEPVVEAEPVDEVE